MTVRFRVPVPRLITMFTLFAVMLGVTAVNSADKDLIDMSYVINLSGRFTVGHACPVGENIALTAAHMIDPRWVDPDFQLIPFRFDNEHGEVGVAVPSGVYMEADLGWVLLGPGTYGYYNVAEAAPSIGDQVFWVEYNIKDKKKPFFPVKKDAKVTAVIAGSVYFDDDPESGASGGCLFNREGNVVGVIVAAWALSSTPGDFNTGQAVGLWNGWMPEKPKGKEK